MDYDRHYVKQWEPSKFSLREEHKVIEYPCVSSEFKCSTVRLMVLWLGVKIRTQCSSQYKRIRALMVTSFCNYILTTLRGDVILTLRSSI